MLETIEPVDDWVKMKPSVRLLDKILLALLCLCPGS